MNYTIKTLIGVSVLAIVVLLTAAQVNTQPEARGMIEMDTDTTTTTTTKTEKTQETTPATTQKSTVVRVEKETAKTNSPVTIVAQDDSTDQSESTDANASEETSGIPQLKYTVVKRNRLMIEGN